MPSSFKCLPFVLILVFLPNFAIAVEKCGNLPPLEEGLSKEEKVDALLKRATGCIHEGKLNQTIAILSELIGLDPNNMDGYQNRGSAYIQARHTNSGYRITATLFVFILRRTSLGTIEVSHSCFPDKMMPA